MRRAAMLALALLALGALLAGCGAFSLALPSNGTDYLPRGCESKPPSGECAAGGIIAYHTWRF
jgi:hypothetical protein